MCLPGYWNLVLSQQAKNILIAAIATLIKGDNVNIFQDQYKNTRLHSMTLLWCVWY